MKIVIDGVKLSAKPSGLTNIAMAIIAGLSITSQHDIIVLMKDPPHPEVEAELKNLSRVTFIVTPPKILKSISIFWSIFQINNLVRKINPDLFIAPNFLVSPWNFNKKIKTVVFVHDLVIKEFPETMHWFNRLHMLLLFRYSLKNAHTIWCNSVYTSERLLYFYNDVVKKEKIFIGGGIRKIKNDEKPTNSALINQLNQFKPYILYVGTNEPRKNKKFLIKLYEELYKKYNLVMIGGKGWGETTQEIEDTLSQKPHLSNRILKLSNISTSALELCYKNAEFLISTSFNEGLGLPIIEAMNSGCPVITPHNSAFIEIVDGVEVTVRGWDVNDWQQGIDELLVNRTVFINNGLQQAKKYNWDYVIESFLKFID